MGKRKGGRGGEGGRDGGGGHEDQYGEAMKSQDKEVFHHSGKSAGGGGTAGGSRGANLSFQRQVPKFLQKYSHLLGKGGSGNADDDDEDAPTIANDERHRGGFDGWDEEGQEEPRDGDLEVDALKRAMAENPELAAEFEGVLTAKVNAAHAIEEKDIGNKAFAAKKYDEAIVSFTKCIELDPKCEIYFSNRSAAYACMEQWAEAAGDARQAVALKPKWVKGHARLGAAMIGLKLYSEAVEAYTKATQLEPSDASLAKQLEKAEIMDKQMIASGKHTFKKLKVERPTAAAAGASQKASGIAGSTSSAAGAGTSNGSVRSVAGAGGGGGAAAVGSKARAGKAGPKLSFALDEEES